MSQVWADDEGIDITAAFRGVTTPLRDLVDQIHHSGWTVKSIKFKKDSFEAVAQNPHGEKVKTFGPTEQTAASNLLLKVMRTERMRSSAIQRKVSMWQMGWEDQLSEIAKAYAEASIYEPRAAAAWKELADDSVRRARVLHNQLQVEVTDDPVPYKTTQELIEDVTQKQHILLSRANSNHPIWTMDQVLAFRLVHDVLGHVVTGGDWGWHGENMATQAHMPLLSENAQKALFTEAIGQTAYGLVYRTFGPQKIVVLKEFIEGHQEQQNDAGHSGIHPSQTTAPGEVPRIPVLGYQVRIVSRPVVAAESDIGGIVRDPNHEWTSGTDPLPDNGYLWHRDPATGTDPLDLIGTQDAAQKLSTGWHQMVHPDGSEDRDSQRQAVVNALRSTLLQPRKDPKWGAVHYQDVSGVPAGVSDPRRFHDALGAQREAWNQARGFEPGAHTWPYAQELAQFRSYMKALNPHMNDRDAHEKTGRELMHMWNEEEEHALNDDADSQVSANDLAKLVAQNMKRRLGVISKGKVDQKFDFGDRNLYHSHIPDAEVYGDWVGNHLNSVAGVGRHADELTDAALEDMRQHGGRGHHFRTQALRLGIPGVGPKEISHSWTHLNPQTSELATLDPHMMEILGHRPEEMNDRDYFKFERELAAGRDASGYNHVPLGMFGQGLWDQKMYGPGNHPDRTHLKALGPTPYQHVDWDQHRNLSGAWPDPEWWAATQPMRDQTGDDFDRTLGVNTPRDAIPFQHEIPELPTITAGVEAEGPTPWFVHPDDGVRYEGAPGQGLMQHLRGALGLSTEQIWAMDPEAGKT